MTLNFFLSSDFGRGSECRESKPTSKSWLRTATELSSLKSIRDVAKVRKKVPSGKTTIRFSSVWVSATSHVCGVWIPHGWITFDSALEQLREDAIGSQLMEDTAQELLGHPRCIAGEHHAGVDQGEKTQGILEQPAWVQVFIYLFIHIHISPLMEYPAVIFISKMKYSSHMESLLTIRF